MSTLVHDNLPHTPARSRRIPPRPFFRHELPTRPERLPRGPRRIRDGLWSAARYGFDELGREIASMTHADGHSIVWPVDAVEDAALIGPDGRVVDRPEAWREAHAFAFHWGAA